MHTAPTRGQRLSLFVTVLSLFLFGALLVGTGVTVTNYVHTRQTAARVASDTFDTTIDRINERRLAFFAPVFLIAELLRNDPSFHQSAGPKEAIRPLIVSALTLSPQISAVYAGYDNGNYFQILSISEAEKPFLARLGGPPSTRFAIQEIRADNDGVRIETWKFLDSDHRQIGTLSDDHPTYDPRHRDWYREASAKPQNIARPPRHISLRPRRKPE